MVCSLCRQFPKFALALGLAGICMTLLVAQVDGHYVVLDGVNDHLVVADADGLSFGDGLTDTPLTFELWVRPDTVAGKQNLLSKWLDHLNPEYRLYFASGTLRLDLRDSSAAATVSAFTTGNLNALVGGWHHLAVTYDGRGGPSAAAGIAMYVDGVAVPVATIGSASYVAMQNWTAPLQMGRESISFRQYDGALDEVRIWNVVRTQSQIQAQMTSELQNIEPSLAAYWRFNEGVGTSVADESLHGLTATMVDGPTWATGGPVGAPDFTPPEISNIGTTNIIATSVTIAFDTNEPTTGWVTLAPNSMCPCTDVPSAAVGTSHVINVGGLASNTVYGFEVKATDTAGNFQSGPPLTFQTLVVQADTTPPTVSISRPVAGTVSGTILVEADASDNIGVAGVQFRRDGLYLGQEVVTPPYSIAWDTTTVTEGSHTITAEARDAANNVSTSSVVVNVSNQPAITSPHYLDLDGVNDHLIVADADVLTFSNGVADTPLTFELWVRPDSVAGKQNLISKWLDRPNQEYRLYFASSTLRLDLQDSSALATVSAFTTGSLNALVGDWHHLAVTYDGRGGPTAAAGIAIYVDGVAVPVTTIGNASYVAMENWTAPLQIGRETFSFRQYDGGIDELRIWNMARTPSQIQTQMTLELASVQAGLIGYWRFNEGVGNTVADDSLHGLTATIVDGPVWMAGGPVGSSTSEPPAITSAASAAFAAGTPGSFQVTATGSPLPTLAVSGTLPDGVTLVDAGDGTGTLAGSPAIGSGGNYSLVITATNGIGTPATQDFTLSVVACTLSPPAGTLPGGRFGAPYALTFTAMGSTGPTFAVTAGALPAGLSLSSGGTLVGTPTVTGVFGFTVTTTGPGCNTSSAYSLAVTPDAQDESYSNAIGNTQYSVGAGVPPTPAIVVTGTVLLNDLGSGTLTAGPASIVSTLGGHVAMSTTGTFLYTPPVGFTGPSDTFTYSATDANGLSDTAVVTVNLSGIVWYVDGSSRAGDGRSSSPFNTMTAASVAAQVGQGIYVHAGSPAGATTLKPGQTLWGAGATFTYNGLTIGTTSTPTLLGTVNLADNVIVNAVSVNGGAAPAIAANALTGTEVLNAVSIVGGSSGLNFVSLSGTVTITGAAISDVSGADVLVSGGTGVLNIGASIVNTAGRSVDIQGRTAGTISFTGPISDTGAGIFLNNNAGCAIAFTAGLALSTGPNPGFTATGGGVVTVTQDNVAIVNTIATTTGTALNVANTEIGAAGLTFRSISAGAGSFSAGNGIILDTTGISAANGGLSVVGNGTAQSGGIIRRKSGPDGSTVSGVGIYLRSTRNPSLNWMDLNRFDNAAIIGRDVSGFLLADSVIAGAGTTVGIAEGPVVFGTPGTINGLQGTAVIRDTSITGGVEDNVVFHQHSGEIALQIERSAAPTADCLIGWNSTTTGARGLLVHTDGSATASLTMNKCRVRNNRTTGLVALALGDSILNVLITGSPADDQPKTHFSRSANQGQGQEGIVLYNAGNARITATIENTMVTGLPGAGIWLGQAPGNASASSMLRATLSHNFVDSPGDSTSSGVVARLSSTVGEIAQTRLVIADHQTPFGSSINQSGLPPGILIMTPDAGTTPDVHVTIANNHVDMRESAPGSNIRGPVGIGIQASEGTVCANVLNNISHWYPTGFNPQSGGIRLEQSASGLFMLERGSDTIDTPAGTVLADNNPAPTFTVMATEVLGSITIVENGACLLPSAP